MSKNLAQIYADSAGFAAVDVTDVDLFYIFDVSALGVLRSKGLTRTEMRRAVSGKGFNAQDSLAGNITVAPQDHVDDHLEVINVGGVARVSGVVLVVSATRKSGDRCKVKFLLPAVADIVLNVFNGSLLGTEIASYTPDNSGDDLLVEFYLDQNGAWQVLSKQYPA